LVDSSSGPAPPVRLERSCDKDRQCPITSPCVDGQNNEDNRALGIRAALVLLGAAPAGPPAVVLLGAALRPACDRVIARSPPPRAREVDDFLIVVTTSGLPGVERVPIKVVDGRPCLLAAARGRQIVASACARDLVELAAAAREPRVLGAVEVARV